MYHTDTYSQHTIDKDMHEVTNSIKIPKIIIYLWFIIKFAELLYICPSSCLENFSKGQTTTECI